MLTIISGGQTGVDQTALQVARELGFRTGGTAPLGWRTDAGPAPWLADYGLTESWSPGYRVRTQQNVAAADLTIWFGLTDSPGGMLTLALVRRSNKPILINPGVEICIRWLRNRDPRWIDHLLIVNVAGNRQRTHPEAATDARRILHAALSAVRDGQTLQA